MTTTSSSDAWHPKMDSARHADTTAAIHRTIAWIYGVLGTAIAAFCLVGGGAEERGVAAFIALIFGAIVALHAALAVGARNRNGAAKLGSVIVGVFMLLGFPIGTIVGGFLIYNGSQNWPPRRPPQVPAPGAVDMRDL